jgi:hypothetical protein
MKFSNKCPIPAGPLVIWSNSKMRIKRRNKKNDKNLQADQRIADIYTNGFIGLYCWIIWTDSF